MWVNSIVVVGQSMSAHGCWEAARQAHAPLFASMRLLGAEKGFGCTGSAL